MLGAIIGDIVGSVYEFSNIKKKDFPFWGKYCEYTDDSILAIATADWILHGDDVEKFYFRYATTYRSPMGGYGGRFLDWVNEAEYGGHFIPYYSCGNGSAMRIAPVGWLSSTIPFNEDKRILKIAQISAECTHNHPEGIKGAQATALSIYLARKGKSSAEIRKRITKDFEYDLSLSVDEIRPRYSWQGLDGAGNGGTCQGSVPQAIVCALEATDFEDAIRNAISIGGDSDTIGCITGGIAEALFGIPEDIREKGMSYLPKELKVIVEEFESKYGYR
jgi:ADP-ribosylglycohydrolase